MSAIRTIDLCKSFKEINAVKNLNLEIEEGKIYGFLGENGAGKTTTLKMLTGLCKPTSGKAYIMGGELVYGEQAVFSKIGYLPDVPNFYDWMTAKEFLLFSGKLFNITQQKLEKKVSELMDLVGLKESRTKVAGFSRGMKQRLGIAQTLINDPQVIMLDEPTSALDPIGRKEVMDIIKSLEGKVTIFLSSHILSDIERVCNRVTILHKGKQVIDEDIKILKSKCFSKKIMLETTNKNHVEKLYNVLYFQPWVDGISSYKEVGINMGVNHIEMAQFNIPKLLHENQIPLVRMELLQPSLEDIFIDVIKG